MLTVKQSSIVYGYKSVHDLPTPPSTSRSSPPLSYQDPSFSRSHTVSSHSRSPLVQPMSASHRGLPPPAAMTLPPQQPPSSTGPPSLPPSHHGQPPPPTLTQASHQPPQPWNTASLPPPPQQWQGGEESMRVWLQAKTEEEKTKQEEERTRQESLRLEQRRVEMDMLRASLGGGIPPPMVPLVFAGMGSGGLLPQAALEWAQQLMTPTQAHHPQLLSSQRPPSPEHARDPGLSTHGVYPMVVAQAGAAQTSGGYPQFPTSPTRPRGQSVSGVIGRPMGAASTLGAAAAAAGLGPNHAQQASHGAPMAPYQGHGHTHAHAHAHTHAHAHAQSQSAQHEASPSIYFHHWQPPTSQAGGDRSGGGGGGGGNGGSNRPGTPSGEAQRKRKASSAGTSQQIARAPSEDRYRSPPPPPFPQSGSSHTSPNRRLHKRQRSEISWFRPMGEAYGEEPERANRARTPPQVPTWGPSSRERVEGKSGKQSVSLLLSREPEPGPPSRRPSQLHQQQALPPPQQQHPSLHQSQHPSQPSQPPPPPPRLEPPLQRSGGPADPRGSDRILDKTATTATKPEPRSRPEDPGLRDGDT